MQGNDAGEDKLWGEAIPRLTAQLKPLALYFTLLRMANKQEARSPTVPTPKYSLSRFRASRVPLIFSPRALFLSSPKGRNGGGGGGGQSYGYPPPL